MTILFPQKSDSPVEQDPCWQHIFQETGIEPGHGNARARRKQQQKVNRRRAKPAPFPPAWHFSPLLQTLQKHYARKQHKRQGREKVILEGTPRNQRPWQIVGRNGQQKHGERRFLIRWRLVVRSMEKRVHNAAQRPNCGNPPDGRAAKSGNIGYPIPVRGEIKPDRSGCKRPFIPSGLA